MPDQEVIEAIVVLLKRRTAHRIAYAYKLIKLGIASNQEVEAALAALRSEEE